MAAREVGVQQPCGVQVVERVGLVVFGFNSFCFTARGMLQITIFIHYINHHCFSWAITNCMNLSIFDKPSSTTY